MLLKQLTIFPSGCLYIYILSVDKWVLKVFLIFSIHLKMATFIFLELPLSYLFWTDIPLCPIATFSGLKVIYYSLLYITEPVNRFTNFKSTGSICNVQTLAEMEADEYYSSNSLHVSELRIYHLSKMQFSLFVFFHDSQFVFVH